MRLLFLTPELPYAPGGSGGSTRQYQLLRRLVHRGDDVTVVAPVHTEQRDGAAVLRAAGVELLAYERPADRAAEARSALLARPALLPALARHPWLAWQVEVFWTRLRSLARDAFARARPDVILVEHDWAARWILDLPQHTPRVLTLENLSWEYYAVRARVARRGRAALLRVEAHRWRRFDGRLLPRYDALLSMSERDRRLALDELGPVRCEVVPNGVDTTVLRPGPPATEPTVLFTGTLSYPPNAEALRWLLRDIWPRIRETVPGARMRIVGPGAPDDTSALAGEGVELAGFVEEIGREYESAQVVVVPMRSGAGTRLKVLDGLASGRPLVSTTMGAEGVDIRDGHDVVLADNADTFAEAVIRLLRDEGLRTRLGAAGRALVVDRYDWDAVASSLARVLEDVVARGASPNACS